MKLRNAVAAFAISSAAGLCAQAATSFGNFESGTAPGFGALTSSSGVQPWSAAIGPANGAVTTATSSSLTGSKVLELTGDPAFNFGQNGGAALGFDFLAVGLRNDFLANNAIEFDWVAVPNGSPSGFQQLFNVALNSQGGGFTNVAGSNMSTPETSQGYFAGYTGTTHHVVVDYTSYKNTILASANPNGGAWIQLGIQPNAGSGAPADMYFDNFQLTTIPEPTALALIGLTTLGLMRRRRSL